MKEGKRTMYRFGHKLSHHYIRYLIGVLALLILASLGVGTYVISQTHTVITQSPAVVRYVPAIETTDMHVQKGIFALDLPTGWQEMNNPDTPKNVYSWRGTATPNDQARRLDVYIDQPVSTLAVNRLLPVAASGDSMQVTGAVSDNCINFTDKTPDAARIGQAPSKWAGVNFLCDEGNYERDVAATGSPDGVNVVALTGATNGQHHILLLYTDNSPSPDYTIFEAIARSFRIL